MPDPVHSSLHLTAENLMRVNVIDVGLHEAWLLIVERVGEITVLDLSRKGRHLYESDDVNLAVILLSAMQKRTFRQVQPKFFPPTMTWFFRDDVSPEVQAWLLSLGAREPTEDDP